MAEEQNLNQASPDQIRHQIEETRASLNHKLETLEGEVRSTVDDAKSSVKRTFSLEHHAGVRPWTVLGASIFGGMLLGAAVVRWRAPFRQAESGVRNWLHGQHYRTATNGGRGITGRITEGVGGAIEEARSDVKKQAGELRNAAVASIAGVVKEVMQRSVPGPFGSRLASIVDHVARSTAG